eukprot:11457374-Alexandrium_andersonii.AAC.1
MPFGGERNGKCSRCSGNFQTELSHRARYQCLPCGIDVCELCVQFIIIEREGWLSMGPPAGLFNDDPEDLDGLLDSA